MVYRATNDTKNYEKGGYMSSIGLATSTDGVHFERYSEPIIHPDREYEEILGCEDPRVTKIGDEYFLYYTAVGGTWEKWEVRIALATSHDFKTWKKHGIVGPRHTTSKAAALFPEKINGKYQLLYTWMADSPLSSIILVGFDSIEELKRPHAFSLAKSIDQYEQHVVFRPPERVFRGAEVGAVPIRTDRGWVLIYCPANTSDHPEWSIHAALLDLHDPRRVLSTSDGPILHPQTDEERHGVVNNVTFPEGAVVVGEELYVYYGSGDQGCCLATCNFNELLSHLCR
jgi:predicted GH43/DUF377 family glycosyl hydrolase